MTDQHRLHLFVFDVTHPPVPNQPVYGFRMPPSWRKAIWPLRHEGSHAKAMGLKQLGKELMQLYPGLLYTRFDEAALDGRTPALVADQPIRVDVLAQHFTRHFNRIGQTGSFGVSDAEWSRIVWSSINHPEDAIFSWLPAYFSRRFAEASKPFRVMLYQPKTKRQVFERELRFYPVSLNGKYGCMTEPYKGFSYAIYFSVETRANQPGRKFLHVHTHIHRYVSNPVNDKKCLTFKRNGTVLIRLSHKRGGTPFVPLSITKSSKPGIIAEWKEEWTPEYLNYFLRQPFELKSLLDNPARYQDAEEDICALLLYNTAFYSSYFNGKVATGGMGLSERKQMFDLVQEVFPDLKPVEPLQKVKLGRNTGYQLFPLTILGPKENRLRIDCHTSHSAFQELIAQIDGMPEGFVKQDDHVYKLRANGPETVVELKHRPDSGVVQEVDPAYPHRTVRRMKTLILKGDQAHGALVEIEPKETWAKSPEADPKQALRVAFAECGQITQFLHDEKEENFQHRVRNAFFDLLSDFGIFTYNLIKGGNQKRVWLFVTAFRPREMKEGRILYARYDGQHYLLRMEGDDGSWRALHDFIIEAQGLKQGLERTGLTKEKQPEIERTILQMLLETEDAVTVVFDREPLSKVYPPVQNQHLMDGNWILKRPELLNQRNRLRFLRISTEEHVPDYHNDVPGRDYSFSSGLFLSADGVYYSLGEKPDTHQLSVLYTKATNPLKRLPQPNLVEFLPVGHWERGEAEDAVRQLHLWRRANLTFSQQTIYPAPLHRLNAVKKYLEAFLAVDKA